MHSLWRYREEARAGEAASFSHDARRVGRRQEFRHCLFCPICFFNSDISLSEDLIVIKRHPVMIIEDLNDASLVLEKLIYYSTGKETQGAHPPCQPASFCNFMQGIIYNIPSSQQRQVLFCND
jgi:hypothetical protein